MNLMAESFVNVSRTSNAYLIRELNMLTLRLKKLKEEDRELLNASISWKELNF